MTIAPQLPQTNLYEADYLQQTVRAGLADQSVRCNGFNGKTRPYQRSNLFNSHSLTEQMLDSPYLPE